MEFDITKMVEEIAMQAIENQEEFIFETINPYCGNVLQMKVNKEELKQILFNGIQKQQPYEDMRDATEEERKSTKDYIDSISKPTGLQFDDIYEELDFVQPHKKTFVNLQPCEDCINRRAAIDTVVFECGEWTGLAKEISKQLRQLPPVTPTLDASVLDEIIAKIEQTRDKDKIAEYPYNRCIRIIEEYKGEN